MTDRPQINIRLDRDLLGEVDELAKVERVDRSEMARRLLDAGLVSRRMELALREYRAERVTAWKAAEIAHVSLYEMLDRIYDEGIPYDLDPVVLERVDAIVERSGGAMAVAESSVPYGDAAPPAATSGNTALRDQFRPEVVRWLFVGESSPAGGTHFYRANSNLFRATREAFAAALGEDVVPSGARFLHFFREQGAWLIDLADRPVNRMRGRPRNDAVDEGVTRMAELIGETEPEKVIVVKASIAGAVRRAAAMAGYEGEMVQLPFPVRQWRSVYTARLARVVAPAPKWASDPGSTPPESTGEYPLKRRSRPERARGATPGH